MSDDRAAKQLPYYALFLGLFLMFGAFDAVFGTPGEYTATSGAVWLEIALDAGMTFLLPFLLAQIVTKVEPGGLRTASLIVGGLGILAGLIQLAARFTGNRGWWTGHFG